MTPVLFHFLTSTGIPLAEAKVQIRLTRSDFDEVVSGVIMPRLVEVVTDEDGKVTVPLAGCDTKYHVTVWDPLSDVALHHEFYVPVQEEELEVRLQDIIVPITPPSYNEATLALVNAAKTATFTARDAAAVSAGEAAAEAAITHTDMLAAGVSETNAATSATAADASATESAISASESASSAATFAAQLDGLPVDIVIDGVLTEPAAEWVSIPELDTANPTVTSTVNSQAIALTKRANYIKSVLDLWDLRFEFAVGIVADGDAATFTGTDNSVALQAMIDSMLNPVIVAQGGVKKILPTGVICFNTPLVADHSGASFFHLIGNNNSTRLIYRGTTGAAISFIGGSYDGTYPTFHSRITIEGIMVFCLPAEVAAGNTIGLSFEYCAEVTLINAHSHYANQGIYIKDCPLFTMERPQAINCNRGISLKKSRSHADADLAVVTINDPWCSGNAVDVYVDGGRDIKINDGSLVSTKAIVLRATGSTTDSDQIELFQVNGTFIDYQDLSVSSIDIGDPADTTFQIKKVELNNLKYASSPDFTTDRIRIDSPLVINVSVTDGECSEVVDKFVAIGSSCLKTIQVSVDGIGANNCFKYRIRDERSTLVRTELFQHQPSLQRNPGFFYFAIGGYFPLGFDIATPGNIQRSTAAGFVTGDSTLLLLGTGTPNPPAAPIWLPQHGDVVVGPGTDLEIEWIVLPTTSAPQNTLWVTTTNIDGSGLEETVADPLLTSIVQVFTNGMTRMLHAYKVPCDKVCVNIRVRGIVGENVYVDWFNVYGPSQYLADEMLYIGNDASLVDAAMQTAKFRGIKIQKRSTGENDAIYACRRNSDSVTFSWQLIA